MSHHQTPETPEPPETPSESGQPTNAGQNARPTPPIPVTGAVIIPAHNEENVIARTLQCLAPFSRRDRGDVEVIVVCNGCADRTADVARTFTGVTVIEIGPASKPTAMNVGDAATARWPRLYLDADIQIQPAALEAVFQELRDCAEAEAETETEGESPILAARASATENTHGASIPVRAYFRARGRIPEKGTRLWGAGGYAVSRRGHERFERFPEVTNDDSYFDSLFAEHEKRVLDTEPMLIQVPRTAFTLVSVLTRHRRGQLELGMPTISHPKERARALLRSVRGVPSAFDAFWYAALTEVARLRSRRVAGRGTSRWETDATTRPAGAEREDARGGGTAESPHDDADRTERGTVSAG